MRDGSLNCTLLVSAMESCLLLSLQELGWALSLTKRKERNRGKKVVGGEGQRDRDT